MVLRHPLLWHHVTKHRRLLCVVSAHVVMAIDAIKKLPSRRLFPQPGQLGGIEVSLAIPKLTHGAEFPPILRSVIVSNV
jgi:hypothetical protein